MQFWRVASEGELAPQPPRATRPQPRSRICSLEYDFFELSLLCSGSTGFVRELGIIGVCGGAPRAFSVFFRRLNIELSWINSIF